MERIQKMFGVLFPVLNDGTTTLDEKLVTIAENYINMLTEHPELPIFVLSEIRNNPEQFSHKMQVKTILTQSVFIKQLRERKPDINPLHFLMNLLGMTIFPFIGKPVLQTAIGNEADFGLLMEERKKLIPKWIITMLDE